VVSFEESAQELGQNIASLGFDLDDLIRRRMLVVDNVRIERAEIVETGEYDLEALFLRMGHAIDSIGARRVAIDTLEALFGGLSDEALIRAELRRLFEWLKAKGVTAVITAERGERTLTRHGLEEYVSDCVILLDQRVVEEYATRRLRVVKYRGSSHGTSEYPFLIGDTGISVLPLSSARLDYAVSDERVSSGVPRLDSMLGGEGYYRGSSILVSGTAGSGKTTLAAHFADATCARGERFQYFAFEESPDQIVRNMRSIGIDLDRWRREGLLDIQSARPSNYGLELHLATMHGAVRAFRPSAVVLDPISNFGSVGDPSEIHSMLLRMVDFLRAEGITSMYTSLVNGRGVPPETVETGVSSLVDTCLALRDIELGGERNRGLYVLKSRGMAHSNQIREYVLGPAGIELLDVYAGAEGVLTGSMRVAQEAREHAEQAVRESEIERRRRTFQRRREVLEAQIRALSHEIASEQEEMDQLTSESTSRESDYVHAREAMAHRRGSDELSKRPKRDDGRADEGARP
jgi:circadian clock protein KaiC